MSNVPQEKHFCDVIIKNNQISNCESIFNLLNKENNKNISLLVGEVQSGKTRTILNLIKIALLKYDYNVVIFLCGTNNNLKEQSITRMHKELQSNNFVFIEDHQYFFDSNKKIIIPLLKEDDNLLILFKALQLNAKTLHNFKFLIIDDESDFGSINTGKINERTRINSLISKIYYELNLCHLLLVTATPYGNILNSNTSYNEKAKYVFKIPSNNNYTGISFFNKLPEFYLINSDLPYALTCYDESHQKIYFALFVWLYQSYLFIKKYPNEKSTLLIYLSDEKKLHDNYYSVVSDVISQFDSFWYEYFLEWLKKTYKDLTDKDLEEILNFVKLNLFKENLFKLNGDVNDVSIQKINSCKLGIVIGGVMLSRGITYENLLVELFLYVSKNNPTCDTLLQRSRWFGYRAQPCCHRYRYMRLITSNYIKQCYKDAEKYNNLIFCNNSNIIALDKLYNEIKKLDQDKNVKVRATSNAKK